MDKEIKSFANLDLIARQVVEGFITGIHKSPFHGFSVEFAEHRLYNKGESTRFIDWKLFAKTEKLYAKRFDEETNLRCHIIIDNSTSMQFPSVSNPSLSNLNKISFASYASAALMEILKRQRDAVGVSIYSDTFEYYTKEKGSNRHRRMILSKLESLLDQKKDQTKQTNTFDILHQVAEKVHRRSLIFLFTDMFQIGKSNDQMFEALRHLKYNKHELVLFHTYDKSKEICFDFDNTPKKFVDVETGESVDLFSDAVKEQYQESVEIYFNELRDKCMQYQIDYVPVDIGEGFSKILQAYLVKRKQMM